MIAVSVFAVDIGSLRNIGWWHSGPPGPPESGTDLDDLANSVAVQLNDGILVALGFEAPLFIPRPATTADLCKQRDGERGRPWSAGAGTGALALGLQQATYVFEGVAARLRAPIRVTFELAALLGGAADLLIWEAFVSGKSKDRTSLDPHVDDARAAVLEFQSRLGHGSVSSDISNVDVLNLAASGLLASGLSDNPNLLKQPCVVVRAPDRANTHGL